MFKTFTTVVSHRFAYPGLPVRRMPLGPCRWFIRLLSRRDRRGHRVFWFFSANSVGSVRDLIAQVIAMLEWWNVDLKRICYWLISGYLSGPCSFPWQLRKHCPLNRPRSSNWILPCPSGRTTVISKLIKWLLLNGFPWVLLIPWGSWQTEQGVFFSTICLLCFEKLWSPKMLLRLWHL